MQRSGTEAIRTQLQPSKPKREITNITNSQIPLMFFVEKNVRIFCSHFSNKKSGLVILTF